MNIFYNLDLLSVGIAMASIGLLGFAVYFNNWKSESNRAFLYFSIMSILWGIVNYLNYKFSNPSIVLLLWRLVIFFATWHAFTLFNLIYTFPDEKVIYSRKYKFLLIPIVVVTSFITLSPLAFVSVTELAPVGLPSTVSKGPGMLLFVFVVIYLIIASFYLLLKKIRNSKGIQRKQLSLVFIGLLITFFLLVIFNFLLPALFDILNLSPLGAIFLLPFVVFTAYTVYMYRLFNIRDFTTIFISFALTVTTFVEIIFADSISLIIFRASVFLLVLVFSIQLIRNMINLEHLNSRLKELDQLKSEFVSLATHQIRAPLSAIKGYISEIFEGDFGPLSKELEKPLRIVAQSTENLVEIVGDFLNISRIEQGTMKYELAPLDFKRLVMETVNGLKPNIERAGLELKIDIPENNYNIYADVGKLKQVINNLVDNSIKYTLHGSLKVTMRSDPKTQKILFALSDTGIGIPAEVMPKLFQKFTRAKGANEVNIIGTGLGLYVAKMMIEGQKGRVWAESPGAGQGSTFYVELPVAHVS